MADTLAALAQGYDTLADELEDKLRQRALKGYRSVRVPVRPMSAKTPVANRLRERGYVAAVMADHTIWVEVPFRLLKSETINQKD